MSGPRDGRTSPEPGGAGADPYLEQTYAHDPYAPRIPTSTRSTRAARPGSSNRCRRPRLHSSPVSLGCPGPGALPSSTSA
ncbi:hypothetical protein ACFQZC_19390 [Streptacidiphilus monticola]